MQGIHRILGVVRGSVLAKAGGQNAVAPGVINKLKIWNQTGNSQIRSELPRLEGENREKALRGLASKTKVKTGDDGTRYFLLHRGMSTPEAKASISKDDGATAPQNAGKTFVSHAAPTSWTPHQEVAAKYAQAYKTGRARSPQLQSAWVAEHDIHTIPHQLGQDNGGEHEVIVGPHRSAWDTSQTSGPWIHGRVNLHGAEGARKWRKRLAERQNAQAATSSKTVSPDLSDLDYHLNRVTAPKREDAAMWKKPRPGQTPKQAQANEQAAKDHAKRVADFAEARKILDEAPPIDENPLLSFLKIRGRRKGGTTYRPVAISPHRTGHVGR